jgi:hypothetical protein
MTVRLRQHEVPKKLMPPYLYQKDGFYVVLITKRVWHYVPIDKN